MFKGIKIILLPLLLIPILALFSFYGCDTISGVSDDNTGTTTPASGDMSQQQLEQLLTNAVNNLKEVDTYKFVMDMDIIADVTGGFQSGSMTIETTSSGAYNLVTDEIQMTIEMWMEAGGMGQDSMSMNMAYDMYLLTDWLYMKVSYSGITQWMKVAVSPELKDELGLNTVDQQMQPLDSPANIEYLGNESVDGVECYMIAVTPNMDELAQYLNEQNLGESNIDWDEVTDIYDMFKEFTYICYITKDTNYVKKIVVNMVMEMSADQAGASSSDFDSMLMTIRADMKVYDYNVPFSITLPEEAENATEVSEDMFF